MYHDCVTCRKFASKYYLLWSYRFYRYSMYRFHINDTFFTEILLYINILILMEVFELNDYITMCALNIWCLSTLLLYFIEWYYLFECLDARKLIVRVVKCISLSAKLVVIHTKLVARIILHVFFSNRIYYCSSVRKNTCDTI